MNSMLFQNNVEPFWTVSYFSDVTVDLNLNSSLFKLFYVTLLESPNFKGSVTNSVMVKLILPNIFELWLVDSSLIRCVAAQVLLKRDVLLQPLSNRNSRSIPILAYISSATDLTSKVQPLIPYDLRISYNLVDTVRWLTHNKGETCD